MLKLLFLLPIGGMFLAFTLYEDIEFYFIIGFFVYWLFALGNVVFPYVETCRKYGCNPRYVLSTPINTLFTKQEVENYYTTQILKIGKG